MSSEVKVSADFLDKSAEEYHSTIVAGWEKLYEKKRERLYQKLSQFHLPGHGLELGCADGIITKRLCKDFETLTVVDGSSVFLDELQKTVKSPNLKIVHSLFEEFEPGQTFSTIHATHILEHLDDPIAILSKCRQWLSAGGRILVDVPNADSLHRLIGVKLGMLSRRDDLNQQDIMLGHKRVYTPRLLASHIQDAGFHILHKGGIMIKPLSNRQIESQWSDELIEAFFAAGDNLPDLCSEIYVVAEKRD